IEECMQAPKGWGCNSFESSGLDDSALHSNHRSVGSVVSNQFGEGVLDSCLDGFFRNRELVRNLFVGIPGRDQPKDFDFCRRQGVMVACSASSYDASAERVFFPA